jgi:hypothetical protein
MATSATASSDVLAGADGSGRVGESAAVRYRANANAHAAIGAQKPTTKVTSPTTKPAAGCTKRETRAYSPPLSFTATASSA